MLLGETTAEANFGRFMDVLRAIQEANPISRKPHRRLRGESLWCSLKADACLHGQAWVASEHALLGIEVGESLA